jgi:hypothetical protein
MRWSLGLSKGGLMGRRPWDEEFIVIYTSVFMSRLEDNTVNTSCLCGQRRYLIGNCYLYNLD